MEEDLVTRSLWISAGIGCFLLFVLVIIGFRHKNRERKEGNVNASFWGALLPATSKRDKFAAMTVDMLVQALVKRVLLLAYFAVVVAIVKNKVRLDVWQWVLIGVGGIPLSWGVLGKMFMLALKDLGRCREAIHLIVPVFELFIAAFLSLVLCWIYAFKFVIDILSILVFIWKRKKGLLDDVPENCDIEDKATFGSYDASKDEDLKKEEPPFESWEPMETSPSVPSGPERRKLEDGTVIEKSWGHWEDVSDRSKHYKENFGGDTFSRIN